MKPEEYEKTKTALLLLGSFLDQFTVDELHALMDSIKKAEEIGIVDWDAWVKVRGDTDILKILAEGFLSIKMALLLRNKRTTGGSHGNCEEDQQGPHSR